MKVLTKKEYGILGVFVIGVAIVLSCICCKYLKKNYEINNKIMAREVEKNGDIDESNIERVHTTYKFDTTKVENIVSDGDCTFVAKVNSIVNTVHKYPVKLDNKWISMPYTRYRLKVLKNIKGNIKENKDVYILKAGGKIKNSSRYMIYDNDILPKKGEVYVFTTYTQKDGSLLATGMNSVIKVGSNYKKNNKYIRACKAKKAKNLKKRTRYYINKSRVYKNR